MENYTPPIASKKDVLALPLSFGLFTLFFWALLEGAIAFGLPLVWLLFVAAATLYIRATGKYTRTAVTTLLFIGSVIFTPIYALTDWGILKLSVFFVQLTALLLWIAFSMDHGGSQKRLSDLLVAGASLALCSLEGLFTFGEGLSAYHTLRKQEKAEKSPQKRNFPWGIVGGFLLSLPVLCILIPLLAGADAAFEEIIADWIHLCSVFLDNFFHSMGSLLIALFLALLLFYPAAAWLFSLCKEKGSGKSIDAPFLSGSLLLGFYGSISLLGLTYLFSQLSYLFNGFLGTLPLEMTAAEYARRGFFEIFTVSMIMLIVIGAGVLFAKQDGYRKIFNVLISFLCAFDLLLISTALAKMVLYMRLYGLTVKRLTVSATLLLLAVIFLTILLRRIFPKVRSLPIVLAAALLLFGIPSFADPHRVVAEYNVWAWEKGYLSTIDTEMLAELSDAAIPALIRVYESDDPVASQAAEQALRRIYQDKCVYYALPFDADLPTDLTMKQYSISRQIAHHALNQLDLQIPLSETPYEY